MKDKVKEHFYAKTDFIGASPTFWLFLVVGALAAVLFFARQMSYVPVDTYVVTGFVLDESKGKASSYKKYFPKPYSVKDIARGDQ